MAKLNDYELELLINTALDTKDEKFFKEILEKQEKSLFFPEEEKTNSEVAFLKKTKSAFLRDIEIVLNAYRNKHNPTALEDMLGDIEALVSYTDEKMMNFYEEEIVKAVNTPQNYAIITPEQAFEAYNLYGFPNEQIEDFIRRYYLRAEGENQ